MTANKHVASWESDLDRRAIDEAVTHLILRLQSTDTPSRKLNALYSIRRALQSGRAWLTQKQRDEAVGAMRIMLDACDQGKDTGCGILPGDERNHSFACTRARMLLNTEKR